MGVVILGRLFGSGIGSREWPAWAQVTLFDPLFFFVKGFCAHCYSFSADVTVHVIMATSECGTMCELLGFMPPNP